MKVCFILLLCTLQSFIFAEADNPNLSMFESLQRHNLLQSVAAFTSYHLYFKTHRKYANVSSSSQICPSDQQYNHTEMNFLSHIDRSLGQTYRYRQLTDNDVIWKPTSKDKDNATAVSYHNSSAVEVVHSYLIVALLFPSHPFSTRILESLLASAAIFPVVTITTMNAYKFRTFSAQYDIKFYPKLIFFKGGIKQFIYDGGYSPGEIAEAIAKFTESLPRAYPILRTSSSSTSSYSSLFSSSFIHDYEERYLVQGISPIPRSSMVLYYLHKYIVKVVDYISSRVDNLSPLSQLKTYSCIEPVAGTFGFACEHELVILAITMLYMIIRFIYGLSSFMKSFIADDTEA